MMLQDEARNRSEGLDMKALNVRDMLGGRFLQDAPVSVKGWIRTHGD